MCLVYVNLLKYYKPSGQSDAVADCSCFGKRLSDTLLLYLLLTLASFYQPAVHSTAMHKT